MFKLIRTNSANIDFIDLVKDLDADLAIRDGDEHAFYNQFNKIDEINFVLLAYENEIPVGCGAIKEYETGVMEVKRMYVKLEKRGNGIASLILIELEKWALELNIHKLILETGVNQPEAIKLYMKNKYYKINNYGQYAEAENSFCFEKQLKF